MTVHRKIQVSGIASKAVFIVKELKWLQCSKLDDNLGIELLSFMKKIDVNCDSVLFSIDPKEIAYKCVLVDVDDEIFCVGLDVVLEGN